MTNQRQWIVIARGLSILFEKKRNKPERTSVTYRLRLEQKYLTPALAVVLAVISIPDLLLAQVPRQLAESEESRVNVISDARKSTVCIFSTDGAGGGSGVIIDSSGYALTNYHVADPCGEHLHCGLDDGQLYDAVIVGIDPVGDLAMIKLLGGNDFHAASIGDSDLINVGDTCYAIGNPFLLATDFQPTVTMGIISGVNRYQFPSGTLLEYPDCIQTDAAINPGNSGGPLFNASGELIGINGRGSFEKRGRVNVGVGYAISINQAMNFAGTLRSGGILDHASLGAVVATASDRKVRVIEIDSASDAYRKGLRYDDEIISAAGRKIESTNDLKNILGTFPPHWKIPLTFRNEKSEQEIVVQLTSAHSKQELLKKLSPKPKAVDLALEPRSIPKVVLEKYLSRRGFANFFFHNLERDRVLQGIRKSVTIARSDVSIAIQGKTQLDSFVAVLQREKTGLKIGDDAFTLSAESALEYQTRPKKSGGLLNLLTVWRSLLFDNGKIENLSQRTLVSRYVGTGPFVFAGETNVGTKWKGRKQYDVLRVAVDGTVTDFFVDENYEIVAAEYFSFPEADSCVVQFSNYEFFDGIGRLPKTFKVIFREKTFAEIDVKSYLAKQVNDGAFSREKEGDK